MVVDGTGDYVVNLIQAQVIWEKGTTTEKMPPSEWPTGKSMEHFLNY